METTFYEDSRYRGGSREEVMRGMKRPMTLDLNPSGRSSKKPRGNSLLTSPDLHMLKLESPELEKLIMQQHAMGPVSQCMYPKVDERDPYPRDFPDPLGGGSLPQQHPPASNAFNLYNHHPNPSEIGLGNSCGLPPVTTGNLTMVDTYGYHPPHPQQPLSALNGNCNGNNPMVSSTMSSNYVQQQPVVSNGGYYSMEPPMVAIKEEPQTVPCASPPDTHHLQHPPRSPIDMEDQEKLKLERKRLRNRIAASKCRRRKLERIARLEDKVALLKSENSELQNHVTRLKEHVCHLKQQVLDHVRSGCDILITHPAYGEDL